jgi:hypothetical protein
MLILVSSLKLVCEIALLSLAGRWLLGLLAGAKREQNFFYQLLSVMTRPVERVARAVSPRIVLDRHVPMVAFLLLAFIWVFSLIAKVQICLQIGMEVCR